MSQEQSDLQRDIARSYQVNSPNTPKTFSKPAGTNGQAIFLAFESKQGIKNSDVVRQQL